MALSVALLCALMVLVVLSRPGMGGLRLRGGGEGRTRSSTCRTSLASWTTYPGTSSQRPASVPSYLAVIVSSSITKNGSVISGIAPHVVIVKTDPGYAADPGHDGTGTVVATLR